MAKAATSKADPDKKKKKKAAGKTVRATSSSKAAAGKKASSPKSKRSGFDSLVNLVDQPFLADLLAVGALAAVQAIADQRLSNKSQSSSKSVKSAGKAAAVAIGQKLMGEFGPRRGTATRAKSTTKTTRTTKAKTPKKA
ncbi:MAG TPA: hypothetical protein VNI79_07700 [Sphingomicrobium sp.]|nr:hypothetical protein [Sphingomicrobium sp.]